MMKISYRQIAITVAVLNISLQCVTTYAESESDALLSPVTTNATREPKATDILFEQANFWQYRKRGDLARNALQRILSSEPSNLRAMYAIGLSHVKENSIKQANKILRQMAGTDPRSAYVTQLGKQIKNNTFDQSRLEEARQLQAAGKSEQALKAYDVLFADKENPGLLSLEYYHTMSSIQSRRGEAISGLEGMRVNNPENNEIVFTLAQVLTYDEATRRRGLDILRSLAGKPDYNSTAMDKYRDALLWLDASSEDETYFEYYLVQHPQDKEVIDRLQSLSSPFDPSSYEGLLHYGFESLNNNQLQKAKKLFQQATETTEDNAEALAGLALIEQRRGLHTSALSFYNRALKKDASLRSKYQSAISSAQFWSSIGKINQPNYRDNPDAALTYLNRLKTTSAAEQREVALQRSLVYFRAKEFSKATRNYEQILRDYPNEERAIIPLLKIALSLEDYVQLERLHTRYQNKRNDPASSKQLKLTLYWVVASLQRQRSEMNRAIASFERALSIDPNDIWIRLDYARLLFSLNQPDKAKRIASGISVLGDNRVNGSYALALFYSTIEDWDSVVNTLAIIPRSDETEEVTRLRLAAEFRQDIDSAIQQAKFKGEGAAEEALMSLYKSSPEVDSAALLIVSALHELKLRRPAIAIIRETTSQRSAPSINARLAFVGYLNQWGEFDLSDTIIATLINEKRLNASQRTQLSAVKLQLLLARSASAIESQAYSQAQTDLNSALSIDSSNVQALRMLGRLNQLQDNLDASIQHYMEAISVEPTDLWAIKGAVGVALQAEDLAIAREVLDSAIEQLPDEPDIYELLSRVARAAGDSKTAIESMAYARLLRQQSSKQ